MLPLRRPAAILPLVLSVAACARAPAAPVPAAPDEAARQWLPGAVIYGVVPRNFGARGATSVIERLDGLRELGADALWLPPATATPDGDFGYAVTDYFSLRRDFGTPAEFRRLVDEAHRRGMRVLLDFVPDHTADRHPCFLDASARGPASPCWSFYDRDPAGRATHYFDWTNLPNLNYGNPAVRRMMLDAFTHWVQTYDVDGFRVDAAWGVRDRAPRFFPSLRARLDETKPGLALIAEASAREPDWRAAGFDGAYDWTGELGRWAWEHVFDDEAQIAPRLHAALAADPEPGRVLRFLNNNDTGPRFITRHGLPRTRVAAALLLTLPGIPLVYTGDEVGAEFEPYRDARPIDWRDRRGLRAHYKRLIALRHGHPPLASGQWRPIPPDPDAGGVYSYLRFAERGAPILVVLNFGRRDAVARVALPPEAQALRRAGALRDLYSGELVDASGESGDALRVPVGAFGFHVLESPAAD